jgi:lipopolysaccharide transport system permease protein
MSLLLTRMFDPRPNAAALREAFTTVRRYRPLVVEMTRRELLDRYAGNAFGGGWAVVAPLLMLASSIFAFVYVMRLRLDPGDSGLRYAVFVLAGMVPWIALSDALSRAPSAVVGSANLVKQIVFPSEVLPLKVALASFPNLFVGTLVVVALALATGAGSVAGLVILAPLAIMFYVLLISGLVYVVASLGVFLRDIREIIGVLLSVGLFLHPILYPPNTVPQWLERLFMLSPFSHLIWCFRDALFYGEITRPWSWAITPVVGVLSFAVGWRVFRTLRPTFGNAL